MNVTVGIVGGGRMGAGIAQVFAVIGCEVVVVESSEQLAQSAQSRIHDGLQRAVDRGETDIEFGEVVSHVRVITEIAELPYDVQLVVEAVPEDIVFKSEILRAVEQRVTEECLITTNTSSLSVSQLAEVLEAPRRFAGMHFFNPVPTSLLVEVVVGELTSPETVEKISGWVKSLGKEEIVVSDSPGFATSRLGVLSGLEAIRMLEEGVASAEDIDRAMELGYRHPMGPLRLTDLVGLDVRLAIAEYLSEKIGERFTPPQLLREMVTRGELGRKTGHGFYRWD